MSHYNKTENLSQKAPAKDCQAAAKKATKKDAKTGKYAAIDFNVL